MDLLSKDEREALVIEYTHLHDAVWRRGQQGWVVQSILVSGSLLVAFQSKTDISFLSPVLSLILIAMAINLHWTTNKIDDVCFKRMRNIEKALGISGPERMYESQIKGKSWYVVRRISWYVLFMILVGIYLYLVFYSVFFAQ